MLQKSGFVGRLLPFAVLLSVGAVAVPANAQVTVIVDGTSVPFRTQAPLQQGGRVFVPLRGVLERLGATVSYYPPTKLVTATRGDTKITLPVGAQQAFVNSRTVVLETPPFIRNGSVLVPLRFVSEALGAKVNWNATTRTVNIDSGGTAPPPPNQPTAQVFKGVLLDTAKVGDDRWRLTMTDGKQVQVASTAPIFYGKDRVGFDDLWSGDELTIPIDPTTGLGTRVDIAPWVD